MKNEKRKSVNLLDFPVNRNERSTYLYIYKEIRQMKLASEIYSTVQQPRKPQPIKTWFMH
jgi:hypothetical protein